MGNLISKLPSTTTTAAAAATMIFFLYGFVFHLGLQHETHEVSHSGTWIFFFAFLFFLMLAGYFFDAFLFFLIRVSLQHVLGCQGYDCLALRSMCMKVAACH